MSSATQKRVGHPFWTGPPQHCDEGQGRGWRGVDGSGTLTPGRARQRPGFPGRVPVDRTTLSEAIVRELGELFVGELRRVGPELVAADLDGIEQRLQAVGRRVLGRVV